MKKIAIVAGLAVLSTSAFATRARMEGLGQDQAQGSFFMRDSRTMFRNASHINDQKNYISVEMGNNPQVSGTALAADQNADDAPEVEGGFVKDAGKFVYGVWLNHKGKDENTFLDMNRGVDTDGDGTAEANFADNDDRVDIFFGGDAGIQWGVNIAYVDQKDERGDDNAAATNNGSDGFAAEYDYLAVNLGMAMGDIEAYLNMDINEEAKGSVAGTAGNSLAAVDGDFAFQIGGNYSWKDYVIYAEYDKDGLDFTDGSTNQATNSVDTFRLGVAKMMEVNEKSRWFWDALISIDKVENTDDDATNVAFEQEDKNINFTVGFESDVRSWLTLRGAISQNVIYANRSVTTSTGINAVTTDQDTNINTTEVFTGATLTLGDVAIDGVVGLNETDGAGAFDKEARFGLGDDMFARAAFTYNF